MTFKKLLKTIAEEFEIPADKVTALQSAVTNLVDGRLAPLQAQITEFEDKENDRTFESFGKLDEKQGKMLKALVKSNRKEDESYEDALKRVAKEYEVEPIKEEKVIETKEIDPATVPTKKELPSKEDGKTEETESQDEGFSIL